MLEFEVGAIILGGKLNVFIDPLAKNTNESSQSESAKKEVKSGADSSSFDIFNI